MKRKQNNEWIEAMRQSLREAELSPPEDGWARLQRELQQRSATSAPVPAPESVAAKRPAWKIVWPRVAAAAAAVLIGLVAGTVLLRPDHVLERDGDVIASAADSVTTAAPLPQHSDSKSLQMTLAEAVGLSGERSDAPSSSMRAQTLLAAATPADRRSADSGRSESSGLRNSESSAQSTLLRTTGSSEIPTAACQSADGSSGETASRTSKEAFGPRTAESDQADAVTRAAVTRANPAPAAESRTRDRSARISERQRPLRRPTSFSVHAGGGLSGGGTELSALPKLQMSAVNDLSMTVGTGDNMTFVQRFDAGDNTYRHHQPLSFGFSVSKAFPYGLSLESGVIYTLVRSDVRTRHASEDVSQKLHFIGIPLRLNWQFFERDRFSIYMGAGAMAEKCVSAKFGATTVNEPGLQWSALAVVGMQYRLGDVVGLYFEPEGSYYFTETRLRTLRTESPLTLSLRLGVRLSF